MGSVVIIRIPKDFEEAVMAFCRERHYVPGDLRITLIGPSFLGSLAGLEQKLQSICLAQPDFNVVVGGPGCYNHQMLYLNILPGRISVMRNRMMSYLKLDPKGKIYRPHLTIMRSRPDHKLDLNKMLADAQAHFAKPYSFTVTQVELYTQPHENAPFKLHSVIPFTGR